MTINENNQEVFNYIKYYKNQLKYSPWAKLDPNTKREFIGEDGKVGSVHKWESDHPDVGHGTMELTRLDEGKRLDWMLIFTKPFEGTNPAYMTTEFIDSNTTKVVWSCSGEMPFPINAIVTPNSVKTDLESNFSE